jgi:Fe2+ or Zn2+ uptake regulation protein
VVADSPIHDAVAAALRQVDQRYTTQRRRLVDALLEGTGPMTIAQILDHDRSLAQSSAYRNLVILEQVGVVTRVVTHDEYSRYELAEELTDHHHHHLICVRCGDVADFALSAKAEASLEAALRQAARSADFDVDAHRLDLIGTCATCS